MGHTNSTTNYSLPQFVSSDKPAWLTDINGAFSDIDTAIDAAKDAADDAQGDATQALSDASAAASTANTAKSEADGAIASISESFDAASVYNIGDLVIYNNLLYRCKVAVTTPGAWTGSTNWDRITLDNLIMSIRSDLSGKAPNSAVTPSQVNPTVNEYSVGAFSGSCYKTGRIVVLQVVNITPTGTFASNELILSDLPIPEGSLSYHHAILVDNLTGKSYRFSITSDGKLRYWYSGEAVPVTAQLYGQIVYISAS